MTQGAIDLVQADLARKDRQHEQAKLQKYVHFPHSLPLPPLSFDERS